MANIKWSLMSGISLGSRQALEKSLKQLVALGFEGGDIFSNSLEAVPGIFGSTKEMMKIVHDYGIEKIVGMFHDYRYASSNTTIHDRACQDWIFRDFERRAKTAEGIGMENYIVMPAIVYWQVEPVTDDKIHAMADLWNRVGKMSLEYGIKVSCHHEFWCGLSRPEDIDKFYAWTDPKYVYYYCDTAQHAIAGVDPVKMYMKYHDRCAGFHFKDTHVVDTTGEYRRPPDPESQYEGRWFWEIGTPEGKVDYPAMMKALKGYNYRGWVGLEHDASPDRNDSTCYAKWYVDNVLKKIYT
jgi:inosose dehydratase